MGQHLRTHAASSRTPDESVGNEATQEMPLVDDEGPIPTFPPRQLDEEGHLIPISDEEWQARIKAANRALAALDRLPDDDPPGTEEAMMRGIDAHRAPGCKLFEGLY